MDRKLCARKPLSHLCLSPGTVWEEWGKEQWWVPASGTKTPLPAQPVTWQSMLLARGLGPGYHGQAVTETGSSLALTLLPSAALPFRHHGHSQGRAAVYQACLHGSQGVGQSLAAKWHLVHAAGEGETLRSSRQILQMNSGCVSTYVHRTFYEDQELRVKRSRIHLKLHGVKASLPRGWFICSGNALSIPSLTMHDDRGRW